MDRTDEGSMEPEEINFPINLTIDKRRIVITNILLFAILACAFVGGFYLGKHIQFEKTSEFYTEYIQDVCRCDSPIYFRNGAAFYDKGAGYAGADWDDWDGP